MSLSPTIFLVCLSLISSSHAQVVYRRRRTSLGRVIAGAVVGGLALLFFLCLCMMMLRKRRARNTYAVTSIGGGQSNQYGGKPLFGGPWGRSNAGVPQNTTPMSPYGAQAPYNSNVGGTPQAPYNPEYNPEYPPQNAPMPPPAYGKEANYGGNYQPPTGPPPAGQTSDSPYSAAPGPPPAAHTTGQDNSFVGGFRT